MKHDKVKSQLFDSTGMPIESSCINRSTVSYKNHNFMNFFLSNTLYESKYISLSNLYIKKIDSN